MRDVAPVIDPDELIFVHLSGIKFNLVLPFDIW